ncbi:MAG: GerMN domain-containing protein [Candidatus Parcubacteria bacterium]|nr:GerMN domain-containing protein [Candidatus Parcubacteria bacterium]
MSKQLQIVTIILIVLAVIAIGSVAYLKLSTEDSWDCSNGQWLKHGNPSAAMPTTGCGVVANNNYNDNNNANVNANNNTNTIPEEVNVRIDNIKAGDTITTPLTITGSARLWYFEGSFPVTLLDENGKVLVAHYATAQSDWMTENWVPFKAELNFISPKDQNGTLVFMKDNPSDLRELDEKFEIPVKIQKTETLTLKVFFGNELKNPGAMDCSLVYPVDRIIAKTVTTAKASLEELLKGPTEDELTQKYFTSINSGVSLNKVTIKDGVAYADFNSQLEFQVGGSCRVAAIASQIRETLKQFPTVKDVAISIDGRTEDILQP